MPYDYYLNKDDVSWSSLLWKYCWLTFIGVSSGAGFGYVLHRIIVVW